MSQEVMIACCGLYEKVKKLILCLVESVKMFMDIFRIKLNNLRGCYEA